MREDTGQRLDGVLGTAPQVQTDLKRGFGLAEVGHWGKLGCVVLESQVPGFSADPAWTGVSLVQLQLAVQPVSCSSGSCQSVTCLCARWALRPGHVFELVFLIFLLFNSILWTNKEEKFFFFFHGLFSTFGQLYWITGSVGAPAYR